MIKNLWFVPIGLLVSIVNTQAAPLIYGKVFLTADYVQTDYDKDYRATKTDTQSPKDEKVTELNSNFSYLGVKGQQPLTNDTNLIYQLEYGIDVDTDSKNNKGQFYSRNTYLGLSHQQYGTLLLGRHDTPFKLLKMRVDKFGNHGATLSIDHAGPEGYSNLGGYRANNVVMYKSPDNKNTPITYMAAVSLSEVDDNQNNGNTEKNESKNGYSSSLAYEQHGLYAAVAYDKNMGVEDSAWRIVTTIDTGKALEVIDGLTVGAMYQRANIYDANQNAKTVLISGKYDIQNTPWAIKGQFIRTDFGSQTVSELAMGSEYKFNTATIGHIYAGRISRDKYKDDTIVGIGIEYKF